MTIGQWSVVGGQWSVVSGQWSVVGGQWSVVSGQWSVVSCRLPVVGGQWKSLVLGRTPLVARVNGFYDITCNVQADILGAGN